MERDGGEREWGESAGVRGETRHTSLARTLVREGGRGRDTWVGGTVPHLLGPRVARLALRVRQLQARPPQLHHRLVALLRVPLLLLHRRRQLLFRLLQGRLHRPQQRRQRRLLRRQVLRLPPQIGHPRHQRGLGSHPAVQLFRGVLELAAQLVELADHRSDLFLPGMEENGQPRGDACEMNGCARSRMSQAAPCVCHLLLLLLFARHFGLHRLPDFLLPHVAHLLPTHRRQHEGV